MCIRDSIKRHGLTIQDVEERRLVIFPWPGSGYVHPSIPDGHRSLRVILFYKNRPLDNLYARPIQNVIIHVDLTSKEVRAIEDYGSMERRGHHQHDHYDPDMIEARKTILKPLEIKQPEGPSFITEKNNIIWDHWVLRISMHPTHGLVLHQVSYDSRPILFRASLSDLVVPYGDIDPMHCWKHALDGSEFSLGILANSLKNNCDCLGVIKYFDACIINTDGSSQVIKNAICLHEEDYGIAFKHTNIPELDKDAPSLTRRNRRLVISSFFTLANYDYGFYWYLYLDGVIEVEVKLTGIVGVSAITQDSLNTEFAPLIGIDLASLLHDHVFSFRLYFVLDGWFCCF